jgi:putative ABC transport system permease protein
LPEAYFPVVQRPASALSFVVRGQRDDPALIAAVRREIAALDKDLPVFGVQKLDELVAASLAVRRASALLLGAFAAMALLLAVLGVYATMSYAVVQRTREIGVRMALGAQAGEVVGLVVAQGMRLALYGVAMGVPAALAASRLLAAQLYGVGASDWLTHAAVAAVLAGAALVACWLPARLAARVSPLIALRAE